MINVKITRDELRQHNACANGMALFESIVALQGHKRSIYIRDWTPLHMVWCASAYPGFWQWCRDLNIVPQVTLTRANLTRAYLTGANLTGAYLTGANLTGADLTDAYLTRANLTDADLTDADLTDADLTGADLTGADLTRANLTRAYYPYGDLPDTWERDGGGYLRRK